MSEFPPSTNRAELLARLATAGREMSTAAIAFHTAVASLRGLSATETKTVDVLDRHGALTAGELAARTGLAPPSITGLVTRLERKGFVRRLDDPADRRRVRIERTAESVAAIAPLFVDFGQRLEALYATFTDEQLQTILRFLSLVTEQQRQATAQLLVSAPPTTPTP